MGALLHHIAERAGELKLARAIEHGRFDLEQLAADGSPRKPVDHADLIGIPELLFLELRVAEQSLKIALFDAYLLLALSYTLGGFAADRGYKLFEPSDARLAGIAVYDISYRAVRKAELTRGESVFLELLGDKMLLGDMELLLRSVAAQFNDLHAVIERRGDIGSDIRRGYKQHLAQVIGNLKIIVPERIVLFGIEHFEQRGGRIALVVAAELVDLIEQNERIRAARLLNSGNYSAGHRADICLSVAAYLRLVMDAAERYAGIFSAHSAGDRLCDRGLADSGRADEADYLTADIGS